MKFACWMNENDRASGPRRHRLRGRQQEPEGHRDQGRARKRPRPADREAFKARTEGALAQLMDERVITAPRKGGLSVYGTNVLMNITNVIGALPTTNGQVTCFRRACRADQRRVRQGDTSWSNDPTCHACPVACKKEVEITEGPFKVAHGERGVRAGLVAGRELRQ